jgi:hypothetical protein
MNTGSNIPSPSVPMVGPDGQMSLAWWQFFVSLFGRTGSGQGVDSAALYNKVGDYIKANDIASAALVARVVQLETMLAKLTPAGYSYATIAGTQRKLAYYKDGA